MRDHINLVANLALILGLVFVGYQLFQDRQLKVAELAFQAMDTAIQTSIATAGEDPYKAIAKSVDDPNNLSTEDLVQLTAIYEAELSQQRQIYLMELLDIFPDNVETPTNNVFKTKQGIIYLKNNLSDWVISETQRQRFESLIYDPSAPTELKRKLFPSEQKPAPQLPAYK